MSFGLGPAAGLELVRCFDCGVISENYLLLPSVRGDLLSSLAVPTRPVAPNSSVPAALNAAYP